MISIPIEMETVVAVAVVVTAIVMGSFLVHVVLEWWFDRRGDG